MPRNQKATDDAPRLNMPTCLLAIGCFLILASFLPIGDYFAKAQWTRQDSAAFDKINNEYKRSNYHSNARSGLSEEQQKAQREKMKRRIAAMEQRLEAARQQPLRWSRYLLWSGVSLAILGGLLHASRSHAD